MFGKLATRLETLDGKRLAFLDCGKRGSAEFLQAIAREVGERGPQPSFLRKQSLLKMQLILQGLQLFQ